MTRIITIASQKGGVGKTTSIVNLASWLSLLGSKVLVVDLDPQASATQNLGVKLSHLRNGGMKEAFLEQRPLDSVIYKTAIKNLFVAPNNIQDTLSEQRLVQIATEEPYFLRDSIDLLEQSYDYILLDSPPSIVSLPIMALSAADSVIVPLQCEYMALSAMPRLLKLIIEVREKTNQWLQVEGILMTMYDTRMKYARQIVQESRERFKSLMFRSIIPRSTRLSESSAVNRPVPLYDIRSIGSKAYMNLAKEILTRHGQQGT